MKRLTGMNGVLAGIDAIGRLFGMSGKGTALTGRGLRRLGQRRGTVVSVTRACGSPRFAG